MTKYTDPIRDLRTKTGWSQTEWLFLVLGSDRRSMDPMDHFGPDDMHNVSLKSIRKGNFDYRPGWTVEYTDFAV